MWAIRFDQRAGRHAVPDQYSCEPTVGCERLALFGLSRSHDQLPSSTNSFRAGLRDTLLSTNCRDSGFALCLPDARSRYPTKHNANVFCHLDWRFASRWRRCGARGWAEVLTWGRRDDGGTCSVCGRAGGGVGGWGPDPTTQIMSGRSCVDNLGRSRS